MLVGVRGCVVIGDVRIYVRGYVKLCISVGIRKKTSERLYKENERERVYVRKCVEDSETILITI